jgi:hypothetical protein
VDQDKKVFVPEAKVGQVNVVKPQDKDGDVKMKNGLYANINAKRERIAAGSKEKMRKPGSKGAPTAKAFRQSAKTAKPKGKSK